MRNNDAFLKENKHIDFDDMIGKAIAYVQSGRFVSPWRLHSGG